MARIRTIKPEFFTSLTVASLPVEARLTFVGLWTHVDDEGRCVDDARLIKAALWPLDDRTAADVEDDLRALTESSLITRYRVGERSYLAVTGFAEHQKINRPSPSKLPPPSAASPDPDPGQKPRPQPREQHEEDSRPALTEASVSPHEPVPETSLPERIRDQGSGKGKDHHPRARANGPLVAELLKIDDDEAIEVADKVMKRNSPSNPGGYLRTMHRNGDLTAVLDEVRQDRIAVTQAAQRRAQIAAIPDPATEPPPSQVTPEEAEAARAFARRVAAKQKPTRGGDPIAIGALFGQRAGTA